MAVVDIGKFCGNPVNDDEKYKLLREHFRLDQHYAFSITLYAGKSRKFQITWLAM